MTFDARERSRATGHPINLYDIRYGPESGSIKYYTNLATAFTFNSKTYEPLAIRHSDVVSSGNLDKTTLDLEVPESSFLADLYGAEPPSSVVSVIIRQGHVDDLDFKVCWAGRVLGATYRETLLVLECEPISSSLRRTGLTRNYQYACPLVLYGSQCRASKAAATTVVTITSIDGPLVTLPAGWAAENLRDKFVGGIAQWTRADGRVERRGIVKRNLDVLTLSNLATDLAAGKSLTLILGCNHLQSDCANVHNNILNFGGQPAIPLKNPVGITNNFY